MNNDRRSVHRLRNRCALVGVTLLLMLLGAASTTPSGPSVIEQQIEQRLREELATWRTPGSPLVLADFDALRLAGPAELVIENPRAALRQVPTTQPAQLSADRLVIRLAEPLRMNQQPRLQSLRVENCLIVLPRGTTAAAALATTLPTTRSSTGPADAEMDRRANRALAILADLKAIEIINLKLHDQENAQAAGLSSAMRNMRLSRGDDGQWNLTGDLNIENLSLTPTTRPASIDLLTTRPSVPTKRQ